MLRGFYLATVYCLLTMLAVVLLHLTAVVFTGENSEELRSMMESLDE